MYISIPTFVGIYQLWIQDWSVSAVKNCQHSPYQWVLISDHWQSNMKYCNSCWRNVLRVLNEAVCISHHKNLFFFPSPAMINNYSWRQIFRFKITQEKLTCRLNQSYIHFFKALLSRCKGRMYNRLIGPVGRAFANDPGNLESIPGCVITKIFKMVLDTSLLNTQQYKVRIEGKVEQSRERSRVLPYNSV